MAFKRITGTFLDEMTYDIPSHNWGKVEWEREFDTFVEAGIDTVVLIRAGLGERLACPSKAVSSRVRTWSVYQDMVEMFLELAGPRNISFYLGLYDSGRYWMRYDWQTELSINLEFVDEIWPRYKDYPAFKGWYLPHEVADTSFRTLDINTRLAHRLKEISDLPVLISPFFQQRSDFAPFGGPREPEEHARLWDEIFGQYQGIVDYCAFQDATSNLLDLGENFRLVREVADRYGIGLWANTESFDRDMPMKFPAMDWRKLAHKIEAVQPHVDKLITFEFSHFMSPNAALPGARHLYDRYREFVAAAENG